MSTVASSSPPAAPQARPQQTSLLFQLPTEVILKIATECSFRGSQVSFAHTSSALLRICSPRFYKPGWWSMVGGHDLESVKMAVQLGVVSLGAKEPHEISQCCNDAHSDAIRHALHEYNWNRPGDPAKIDRVHNMVEFLLSKGAVLEDRRYTVLNRSTCRLLLTNITTPVITRKQLDAHSRLVHLLVTKAGIKMPAQALFRSGYEHIGPPFSKCFFWGDGYRMIAGKHLPTIMVCLRTHADPRLLERYLLEAADQGFLPTGHGLWDDYSSDLEFSGRHALLEVGHFLVPLFGFLRNAKPVCAEKRPGEVLQLLVEKIDLMTKFKAVDDTEEAAFRNVLATAGRIYRQPDRSRTFHFGPRDLSLWRDLCMAMAPLQGPARAAELQAQVDSHGGRPRLQRFGFEGSGASNWDPVEEFIHQRLKATFGEVRCPGPCSHLHQHWVGGMTGGPDFRVSYFSLGCDAPKWKWWEEDEAEWRRVVDETWKAIVRGRGPTESPNCKPCMGLIRGAKRYCELMNPKCNSSTMVIYKAASSKSMKPTWVWLLSIWVGLFSIWVLTCLHLGVDMFAWWGGRRHGT